jgi:CPA2 family monovalent cation:H+ antiporter-2
VIATRSAIASPTARLVAGGGLVFGVALSVASTVVVLRTCRNGACSTPSAAGSRSAGWWSRTSRWCWSWFLPGAGGSHPGAAGADLSAVALPLAITLGKFAAFVALMWFVGRRVIPWLLHYVAHTGSRELFRLAVLAIALGVAYGAATLFEVSFALGAFFAGMILSESTLSQRAAQETLPLRDAFAVLFFVSVGMLFNPAVVMTHPLALLATLLIVTVAKSAVAYGMMRLFRYPESTALMIAGESRAGRRVLVHPRRGSGLRSDCCRRSGAT